MALLLSLCFGLGIFLTYLALTARGRPAPVRQPALYERVERLLGEAGISAVSARTFLLISVAAGVAVAIAAQLVLGWPVVSLALAVVGAGLPTWYFAVRAERRRAQVQAALADAVDALRAGVRTGLSVEEGIAGLAQNGPEVLRPMFRDLNRDLRLSSFEEALRRSRDLLADPVFDAIATALALSHRVGGRNLSAVFDGLSRSVRATVQVENEARAQQAKSVLSARIIAALPVLLIFMVRGINPGYLDPFGTPEGQVVMAGCLLSIAIGYAGMIWASRLPREERVLRWR